MGAGVVLIFQDGGGGAPDCFYFRGGHALREAGGVEVSGSGAVGEEQAG
jgi:hypothetical protein